MQLSKKSRTLPRLHLIGTLLIVTLLTLILSGFFTWQKIVEHNASIHRLEASSLLQLQERLRREMQAVKSSIAFTQSQTENLLRQRLVEQVDMAWNMADALYRQQQGKQSEAELQQLIVEALRPIRFFNGRGYYFIDEMTGRFVLLPTAPHFEGQLLPDNQDDTGRFIMQGLIDAARQPVGEGFSAYRWYRPDNPDAMADKLAYVRHFEPYDWLIGAGDYTYEWDLLQQQMMIKQIRNRRIGETGYTAIINTSGQVLLSIDSAHLEQQTSVQHSDLEQQAISQMLEIAGQGGGFMRYLWSDPNTGNPAWKVALVEPAGHWGWILISTIFEDEVKGMLQNEVQAFESLATHSWKTYLIAITFSLIVALLGSLFFSRWSSGLFKAYHAELDAQRKALKDKATELSRSENNLSTILNSVEAYIFIKDTGYRYSYVNRNMEKLLGLPIEQILGQQDATFFDTESAAQTAEDDIRVIQHAQRVATEEVRTLRGNGNNHVFMTVKLPLRSDAGKVYGLCGISTDITERKAMEDKIRHLAFYDALTGLANRRLLIDRLELQQRRNERNRDYGALLFIDLDNFKTLNDTLGHDTGDQLLQQVAHRVSFCVREEDTVARFGGDEFVVMLGSLSTDESEAGAIARKVADKILDTLRQEYRFEGQYHYSTPSIGITLINGSVAADDLLKQADLAMYKAKEAGRNRLYFYDPAMQEAISSRAQMESELRVAIEQEQLVLYYQPQVNAVGELTGAEALVRWEHPQRGLVGPVEFISVAEASGLILPLGHWVLEAACRQLSDWAEREQTRDLTLSVNISTHQFKQADFVDQLLALVAQYAINPQRLKLELTESLLIDDIDFAIERMRFLKQQGIGFALDDFGTGYSSLAYIKQLPLDQLKIDRCFIDGLPSDANDAAITRIIISLASELKLWVVAEGVETQAQRDFLLDVNCTGFQGYWFGRPVSAEDFLLNALEQQEGV